MMKNKHAGEVLSYLPRFAEAGLKLNCQLVLCPGFNDGEELSRTLYDLGRLYPAVQSVAAVPVGLTKYREGLEKLTPFTAETAADVIDLWNPLAPLFYMSTAPDFAILPTSFISRLAESFLTARFTRNSPNWKTGGNVVVAARRLPKPAVPGRADGRVRRISLATGRWLPPSCKNWLTKPRRSGII